MMYFQDSGVPITKNEFITITCFSLDHGQNKVVEFSSRSFFHKMFLDLISGDVDNDNNTFLHVVAM